MFLAIDSAENMRYTGVISGSFQEVCAVYDKFVLIFRKHGVNPPFHWRKLSRKVKESCMKDVVNAINTSKLKINIFEHKRLPRLDRNILFYEILPQHIALRLSPWVRALKGSLNIEVDDDYRLKNTETKRFVKALVEDFCYVLMGIRIDSRVQNSTIKATIKQKIGILNLYGHVTKANDSKAVQIIDLILGYDIQFGCRFDKDVLHYWKIFVS